MSKSKPVYTSMVENFARCVKMKEYRVLMGKKAYEIADLLRVDQPEYSKKEHGRSTVTEKQLAVVKAMFYQWREEEINRLMERIKHLSNIV